MTTLFVISGASRGLGASLARLARARGDRVIGIARGAMEVDVPLVHDLSRPDGLAEAVQAALAGALAPDIARVVLVNNAGVVEPIGTRAEAAAIDTALAVNVAAPMLLTRAVLSALQDWPGAVRIVNISSGAATRAIAGWSVYCATKAALEHFGRCVALEQAQRPNPADVVSISPGVIDTGMQAAIRAAAPAEFPDHDRFVALHAQGALASPDAIARKLLDGLAHARRHAGATVHIDAFARGDAPG